MQAAASDYLQAARRIRDTHRGVAMTGAGISVESGIPDFRGAGGLWSRFDPLEYGHIQAFLANPEKVWAMLREMDRLLVAAAPNAAHRVLAELEARGHLSGIVTQNVDSLHQRAGSRRVVEYHGHGRSLHCVDCGRRLDRDQVTLERLPPRCACGGVVRPDFVFFGEEIPAAAQRAALELVGSCDLLLVVGTSAAVAPASGLPALAKQRGAFVIEINPGDTDLAAETVDLKIRQPAGTALPAILNLMDGADGGTETEDEQ